MRNSWVVRAALLTVFAGSASCTDKLPTAPSQTPTPTPHTRTGRNLADSRIYAFASAPTPVSWYTRDSEYVLQPDGTFAFYVGAGVYTGSYRVSDGRIIFDWDDWSLAGPWAATGEITEDSLTVSYNVIMQLDDFENAVYRRTQ